MLTKPIYHYDIRLRSLSFRSCHSSAFGMFLISFIFIIHPTLVIFLWFSASTISSTPHILVAAPPLFFSCYSPTILSPLSSRSYQPLGLQLLLQFVFHYRSYLSLALEWTLSPPHHAVLFATWTCYIPLASTNYYSQYYWEAFISHNVWPEAGPPWRILVYRIGRIGQAFYTW